MNLGDFGDWRGSTGEEGDSAMVSNHGADGLVEANGVWGQVVHLPLLWVQR